MVKKDKKKSAAAKKARVAEKTLRKTSKKESKRKPEGEKDEDDEDIDLLLEEYARRQAQFLKVTETSLDGPPAVRANATLCAAVGGGGGGGGRVELLLFGGETFNGSVAKFYNDLFVYNVARDEWRQITSPNSPLPRAGHCVTTSVGGGGGGSSGGGGGSMWLFGGEFSSPRQGTFYHYNDFWRFDIASREWNRIETKTGKGPPARSGHRMVAWKNYVLVMGGFQDTSSTTKYLSDLWAFDTNTYTWTQVSLPAHAQRPDARSSFSFLPHEQGAVIYGGYSRVKSSAVPSAGPKKGGSKASTGSVAWKPVIHQDTWLLRMDYDLTKVRWERRKKPGNPPNPPRAGVTMAWHKGRGILFGGVRDEEDSDEGLESVFFNDLYAWGIDRNRFFPLVLRKPRVQKKSGNERGGGGRRDRAREDEEELLRNLKALEATGGDELQEDEQGPEGPAVIAKEQELKLVLPHERFNAALAVLDDVLYIYGGTWEKGDREFTFDELFSVDLGKLDGVKTIFSRKDETLWEESDSDDDDEGDEDGEGEDDDDDEMDVDEGEEPEKMQIDQQEIDLRRKEKAKVNPPFPPVCGRRFA